jgi:hypothetical protein
MVFLSPSRNIPGYYLDWATTVSFQTLPKSSFIYRHTNKLCTTRYRKSFIQWSEEEEFYHILGLYFWNVTFDAGLG